MGSIPKMYKNHSSPYIYYSGGWYALPFPERSAQVPQIMWPQGGALYLTLIANTHAAEFYANRNVVVKETPQIRPGL